MITFTHVNDPTWGEYYNCFLFPSKKRIGHIQKADGMYVWYQATYEGAVPYLTGHWLREISNKLSDLNNPAVQQALKEAIEEEAPAHTD